jgi:hypothetical protein
MQNQFSRWQMGKCKVYLKKLTTLMCSPAKCLPPGGHFHLQLSIPLPGFLLSLLTPKQLRSSVAYLSPGWKSSKLDIGHSSSFLVFCFQILPQSTKQFIINIIFKL